VRPRRPAALAARASAVQGCAVCGDQRSDRALPADGRLDCPAGPAVPVVTGLPLGGDHPMHPFAIDRDGSLYVDVASATNACQAQNARRSRRASTRVRSWRRAAASGAMTQPDESGILTGPNAFATGIRNAEGFASKPTDTSWSRTRTGPVALELAGSYEPERKPRNRLRIAAPDAGR